MVCGRLIQVFYKTTTFARRPLLSGPKSGRLIQVLLYTLVTGDITASNGDANTKVAFKNCAPFTKCVTHINDEHVDNADNLDIVMPMYNLIEYSDNYSDTSGSLWHFKRDEQNMNNGNPVNVTTANSSSFNIMQVSLKH